MPAPVHPKEALFAGEKPFPVIPACEHFAGSEKLITKALDLQERLGAVFDITCDCEDGAEAGREKEHAEMIVGLLHSPANRFAMAGARILVYTHKHWKKDVDILVGGAGAVIAYVTIPKCTSVAQAATMIDYIQATAKKKKLKRIIPIHVLVETMGTDPSRDDALFEDAIGAALEDGCASDAVVAHSESQRRAIWAIRRGDERMHKRSMLIVFASTAIAGAFTLLPSRIVGGFFFGS